jgi:hypothetical protein
MRTELVNFKSTLQNERYLEVAYDIILNASKQRVGSIIRGRDLSNYQIQVVAACCRVLNMFTMTSTANALMTDLKNYIVKYYPELTNSFCIMASSLDWCDVSMGPIPCVKGQDAVIEEYRTYAGFEGIIEVSWYRQPIGNESIDQDLCNESIILKKHLFDYIDEQHPGEQPASMDEDLTEYIAEYIKAGKLIYTE